MLWWSPDKKDNLADHAPGELSCGYTTDEGHRGIMTHRNLDGVVWIWEETDAAVIKRVPVIQR